MFRLAAAISLCAVPAFAEMTCAEYDSAFNSALMEASSSLGCVNMSEEAWVNCFTRGIFLPRDPEAIAFVAMVQDFEKQPAYRACFPEREPMLGP